LYESVGLFVPRVHHCLIMKKITKTTKTPAPATKPAAPAPTFKPTTPTPAFKPTTPASAFKPTTPAPALKSTVAPKIKTPAATSPATPAVVTKPKGARVTIVVKADVGFGNSLFIRGSGAGLSWEKGTILENSSNDTWKIVLPAAEAPFAFKVVKNDDVWSIGEDYSAAPGDTVTVTPTF